MADESREQAEPGVDEAQVERRLRRLPSGLDRFVEQIRLLVELCGAYRDGSYREIPWSAIATATAAIAYFVLPTDMVPDLIPGVGYVDDVSVVALAIAGMRAELERFCQFKGYDERRYFR